MSLRHEMWFQGLLLGTFALGAAALLAGGDRLTADAIAERAAEDLRASLGQVIPPGRHDNALLESTVRVRREGTPVTVWQARRDGRVTAVAFRVTGQGYGGPIRLLMGVARDGTVLGVRVLSHSETPGLGDRIERARDDWITDFEDRRLGAPPAGRWAVQKDGGVFDQFSGATVTPRAVVRAVKDGLLFFRDRRSALLAGKEVPS